jgi:hypothetical protein
MIARILSQAGTNVKVMATFYKAMAQNRGYWWVLSKKMMMNLKISSTLPVQEESGWK